jgi:hypothetical protein
MRNGRTGAILGIGLRGAGLKLMMLRVCWWWTLDACVWLPMQFLLVSQGIF